MKVVLKKKKNMLLSNMQWHDLLI